MKQTIASTEKELLHKTIKPISPILKFHLETGEYFAISSI